MNREKREPCKSKKMEDAEVLLTQLILPAITFSNISFSDFRAFRG
jgi:hypothetical protein